MAAILIIEDNQQTARLAAKLLQRAGHTVTLAETGETGLTTMMDIAPDLILVDLGLPDIDGQTVIAMLRQFPNLHSIPLVAFTAWPEETAHSMAKAYGCDGVIVKPINTRLFTSQVEGFLAHDATPTNAHAK